MVNTFLTCSPLDKDKKTGHRGYRISASKLDFKRLNKQITEALQILNLVESFHILSQYFQDPIPKNPYKCYDWLRKIMKQYKELDYYLFLHQGKYVKYKKFNDNPKRLSYDEKYEILEDGSIFYKDKTYPKFSLVLPNDNFFTMGFWSHPIVLMFLHHPDSLKIYINAHLEEFLARGGKKETNARRCKIDKTVDEAEHPIWTLDSVFHLNHKAALLTKEIYRNEPKHYIYFKDFREAYNYYLDIEPTCKSNGEFKHYLWIFSHDRNEPRYDVSEDGELSFKTYSRSKNLKI
jgi:Pyrimidine dimer DNA glycosylase